MNIRSSLVLLLTLVCAQATLTATTTYSFGTGTQTSFATNSYTAGVWTENFSGTVGATTQQIVCVVGFTVADEQNTCGNPGPGNSAHISVDTTGGQPANAPGGISNYIEIDGDPQYGAPISTEMTGLIVGATYKVSFYQASNEEDGSNKAYTDSWQVYAIPGTAGVYICPVCGTPVNPDPSDLFFTSAAMNNPGASSTAWVLESHNFTATATTEVLEFVADAVAVVPGNFAPPLLDLAGVSLSQTTPESGTWELAVVGLSLIFAAGRLRRKRV
jgi:hypothetical protein